MRSVHTGCALVSEPLENPPDQDDRTREWFVPSFGPARFRVVVGLLFLPYTAMVLAFTVMGAMMSTRIDWSRVAGLALIYLLALGIAAHALDALGAGGRRPWGRYLSDRQLVLAALLALIPAFCLGLYYAASISPNLLPIAVLEGFFLLAYNLEWFGGRFHADGWFALSWGALPVIAGYILQTNTLALAPILFAGAAAAISMVEIKASRPYKELRRRTPLSSAERLRLGQYETILKSISAGTILIACALIAFRWPQ